MVAARASGRADDVKTAEAELFSSKKGEIVGLAGEVSDKTSDLATPPLPPGTLKKETGTGAVVLSGYLTLTGLASVPAAKEAAMKVAVKASLLAVVPVGLATLVDFEVGSAEEPGASTPAAALGVRVSFEAHVTGSEAAQATAAELRSLDGKGGGGKVAKFVDALKFKDSLFASLTNAIVDIQVTKGTAVTTPSPAISKASDRVAQTKVEQAKAEADAHNLAEAAVAAKNVAAEAKSNADMSDVESRGALGKVEATAAEAEAEATKAESDALAATDASKKAKAKLEEAKKSGDTEAARQAMSEAESAEKFSAAATHTVEMAKGALAVAKSKVDDQRAAGKSSVVAKDAAVAAGKKALEADSRAATAQARVSAVSAEAKVAKVDEARAVASHAVAYVAAEESNAKVAKADAVAADAKALAANAQGDANAKTAKQYVELLETVVFKQRTNQLYNFTKVTFGHRKVHFFGA